MSKADGQFSVATGLVRSSFLVSAVYAEAARDYGLTPQQGQLLCVLMAQPYGMTELGMMLRLAKSSLTELVTRTTQRGLVRREPDLADRRAVRVTLTEQGGELAEAFYTAACRRLDGLAAGLDSAERDTFAELLGRVVTANHVPAIFLEPDEAGSGGRPCEEVDLVRNTNHISS
jgi:DNA-binding MarR family transcriptional regulator